MKLAVLMAASLSICMSAGSVLAEPAEPAGPANVGQPFGRGVVSQAAKAGEIKDAVHENVPGGLDDVIHEALADEDDAGDIRGHGKTDAPGQNK